MKCVPCRRAVEYTKIGQEYAARQFHSECLGDCSCIICGVKKANESNVEMSFDESRKEGRTRS